MTPEFVMKQPGSREQLGSATPPGPLVEVEWSDSAGQSDWHDPDSARKNMDLMDCISVGYMAEDDERGVLLVMGVGAVGSWLSSMAIPRHAIKEVRPR